MSSRKKRKARRKPKWEERALARARDAKPRPPGYARKSLEAFGDRAIYADRILARWLLGEIDDRFTQRAVHQRRFAGLTLIHGVKWGLHHLVECGHLRSTTITTRGHPLVLYQIVLDDNLSPTRPI